MSVINVLVVACMSAGVGAMLVYFHMDRRERQREQDRRWVEQGLEPIGISGSRLTHVSDWLIFVAMPGVVTGLTLGGVGWLILAIPLWALGVLD